MSAHTPGPWKAVKDRQSWWIRAWGDLLSISLIGSEDSTLHPARANAERIVACLNACEGIADPSAVPALLEALREAAEGCPCSLKERDSGHRTECRAPAWAEVLAKAEGREAETGDVGQKEEVHEAHES